MSVSCISDSNLSQSAFLWHFCSIQVFLTNIFVFFQIAVTSDYMPCIPSDFILVYLPSFPPFLFSAFSAYLYVTTPVTRIVFCITWTFAVVYFWHFMSLFKFLGRSGWGWCVARQPWISTWPCKRSFGCNRGYIIVVEIVDLIIRKSKWVNEKVKWKKKALYSL